MLKILRKHQKKLLAIFTAGLMIVFIIDIGVGRMRRQQADPSAKVIGKFGDTEVHIGEVRAAEQMLRQLAFQIFLRNEPAREGEPALVPLVTALGLPDQVVLAWLDNPLTFVLLEKEARRMPVYVDPQQLDHYMSRIAIRLPDEHKRIVSLSNVPQFTEAVRADVGTLLMVIGAFNRMGDVLKVSQPFIQRTSIEDAQLLTVAAVTLAAEEFRSQAPRPTDEQLREFFKKYADIPPDTIPTEADPLGFGYRIPARVKLQYIALSRQQLQRFVESKKDDYAWELEINRYYLSHQRDFPTTAATTNPATQPTTRPLTEVREQILDTLTAPEVQRLADEIRKKIESTMKADYDEFVKANPATTRPSTAPAMPADAISTVSSSLGVPYDRFEYLEQLAQSIQQQFGILPTVASIAEPMSEQQLAALPGVGEFAVQIFDSAAALAPAGAPGDPKRPRLHVWQPSSPMNDAPGTTYIYRFSEATPAQAPADVNEIADKVREDWKTAWAWDRAKNQASTLRDEAQKSSLRDVAGQRAVRTIGPFPRFGTAPIEGLDLADSNARMKFAADAFKLASQVTAQSQHPLGLVELPSRREVMVVQLLSLSSPITPQELQLRAAQSPLAMRQQWARMAAIPWFSHQSVVSRLGYIDRESEDRARAAADTAP